MSGISDNCSSDYTTRAGTPPVSRNKNFRPSPTSSIVKHNVHYETLQVLSAGPRRQASARTSAESDEACPRKTEDRADDMRERLPIPFSGNEQCVCMCVCACVCMSKSVHSFRKLRKRLLFLVRSWSNYKLEGKLPLQISV